MNICDINGGRRLPGSFPGGRIYTSVQMTNVALNISDKMADVSTKFRKIKSGKTEFSTYNKIK